jgi:hypothetical protein
MGMKCAGIFGGMIRAVLGSIAGHRIAAIPKEVMERHVEGGLAWIEHWTESVTQAARTWLA